MDMQKFDWVEYLRLIVGGGIPGAAIGDLWSPSAGWLGAFIAMAIVAVLLRPKELKNDP
jgi:hypothetical protein